MRRLIGFSAAAVVVSLAVGMTTAQGVWFDVTTYKIAGAPRAIVAADFNNDGRPDLAVAAIDVNANRDGGITVLSNDGDGTFTNRGTILTARGPFSLAVTDFNNDGAPDLVVVNADSHNVWIFLRDTSTPFGFRLASTQVTLGSPRGVATGDLNRDGRADFVLTSLTCNCVQAFLGHGDGRFTAQPWHDVAAGPTDVALGDLDRDGILDLVTNANSGLTLLFGTGTGRFTARRDQRIADVRPYAVTLADLDRNGKLDAALPASAETVVLQYNLSRAGAESSIGYSTGQNDPRDVVSSDVNGDGVPDLLIANRGSGTVSILLGSQTEPAPMYEYIGPVAVGRGARALAVADFDLDGRPDVASANQYDRSVSVLRNVSSFQGRP